MDNLRPPVSLAGWSDNVGGHGAGGDEQDKREEFQVPRAAGSGRSP